MQHKQVHHIDTSKLLDDFTTKLFLQNCSMTFLNHNSPHAE